MLKTVAGVFTILALIAMPFVLFSYFRTLRMFVALLQDKQEEEWVKLGRPTIGLGDGPQSTNQLVDYIWKRRFRTLDDSQIIDAGDRCRKLLLYGFALFATLLIFGFMSQ